MNRTRPTALLMLLLAAAAFAAPAPTTAPTDATATTPRAGVTVTPNSGNAHLLLGTAFESPTGCQPSGWLGEDLTNKLFMTLDSQWLVNADFAFSTLGASGPLPGPAAGYPLGRVGAIVATDTSGVAMFEFTSNFSLPRWIAAATDGRPARVLSFDPAGGGDFGMDADFDPVSGGLVTSDPQSTGLLLAPVNGGLPTRFAGGGTSQADTNAASALLHARFVAVDGAGNVYFNDGDPAFLQGERLRMLRRNDMRVITLGNANIAAPSGRFGAILSGTLTGLCTGEPGALYFKEGTAIRRLALATGGVTDVANDPRLQGDLRYSAGVLYSALLRPLALLMVQNGVVSTAVGIESNTNVPYGAVGGEALASQNPLPRLSDFGMDFDGDGAGGVYYSPGGGMLLHRRADGVIEFVAGQPRGVRMGAHAVRVGADATTHPEEVRGWVFPSGFGNNWSQRLVSPVFDGVAHPQARFEFDALLLQHRDQPRLGFTDGNAVTVQMLDADGVWRPLLSRVVAATVGNDGETGEIDSLRTDWDWQGSGLFHFVTELGLDGNEAVSRAPLTQLRVVVSTGEVGSSEDGNAPGLAAAAVLDNLELRDGTSTLFLGDFEDGTLQGWSLAARNQLNLQQFSGFTPLIHHDDPPGTEPRLQHGFDFTDTTCVFTFTNANDLVAPQTLARLTSPWVALARRDTSATFELAGKLPNFDLKRNVSIWVRVKHAGDTHARGVGRDPVQLTSGASGGDGNTPFTRVSVRYPQDFLFPPQGFDPATGADSLQFFVQLEDRTDAPAAKPAGAPSLQPFETRFPYFDELAVWQANADRDGDGVDDLHDVCADASASGQDADGNGCVDATATMQHVESWNAGGLPLHYTLSAHGDPANNTPEDLGAFREAFAVWRSVPGAELSVIEDPVTTRISADAFDGVNLITFEDPDFVFPTGVVAITPTLSFEQRTAYFDRIVLPGEIVDADILFNPAYSYRTPSHPGEFDLASVAQHEIGHFLGLSHSGTRDATMFYVLQPGRDAASLTADDEAAIAAAYPGSVLASNYGTIAGEVLRGSNSQPIPGALVSAVRVTPEGAAADTVATDYTDAAGAYHLRRLAPGDYTVRLTPLDGSAASLGLIPEAVNFRVAAMAQTNFKSEWLSAGESASETSDDPLVIHVTAGGMTLGADIVSNIDVTAPAVEQVSPATDATAVRIDTGVLVTFSEAVDGTTLGSAFKLRAPGGANIAGTGAAVLTNAGRTLVFTPSQALEFGTRYTIELTTALLDREGVPLAATFQSAFTTEQQPEVAITDVQPRVITSNSVVTVTGAGFDPNAFPRVVFTHNGIVDSTIAGSVTPFSCVVRAPDFAGDSGPTDVTVVQITPGGSGLPVHVSNPFRVTAASIAPPATALPLASTPLPFAPTDVALAPDGLSAIVVGDADLATVTFAPAPSTAASVIPRGIPGGRHVILSPDGQRAYVSRPQFHHVIELDANPASGSFGSVLNTFVTGSNPDALAYSATHRVLYIALPDSQAYLMWEVDAGNTNAPRSLLSIESLTGTGLTGGLALTPDARSVLLTSAQGGVVQRLSPSGRSAVGQPEFTGGGTQAGAASAPAGDLLLWAGDDGTLQTALFDGNQSLASAPIAMGGLVSDVATIPLRNALLASNSQLNQLQIVSLDSTAVTFRQKVSDVGTDLGPRAVSVDGLGTLAAVACGTSRTLQRFSLGRGDPVQRLVSAAGTPGDVIAITVQSDGFGAGASAELGGVIVPFASGARTLSGGAFVVPANAPRGDVSLALVNPAQNLRSLSQTVRIVDVLRDRTPRPTGLHVPAASITCIDGIRVGANPAGLRVSPDGRLLAMLVYGPGGCSSNIELHAAEAGGDLLGARIAVLTAVTSAPDEVHDFEFTPDGKHLLASISELLVKVYDVDRSSPTFGQQIQGITAPAIGAPYGLAPEPLGERVWVADYSGGGRSITAVARTGTYLQVDTLEQATALYAMDASPDGRWLVAGGEGLLFVYSLGDHRLVATSPLHAGRVFELQVTRDGRRVFAAFDGGTYGVYNLDAAAGAVGIEVAAGALAGATQIHDLCAGPTPSSVLAVVEPGGQLVQLELLGGAPLQVSQVAAGVAAIALSPDHRRLWVAGGAGEPGTLGLYQFTDAGRLSPVAGEAQSTLAGSEYPLPVRVALLDAQGVPQPGVLLRYQTTDGVSTLDRRGVTSVDVLTDAAGEAEVVWLSAPTSDGTNQLTVSAPGAIGAPSLLVSGSATLSAADVPPTIMELGPAEGATGILATSELFVRFNQSMSLASVTPLLTLRVNGAPVALSLRSDPTGHIVFAQPAAALPPLGDCELSMAAGALDSDGQTLQAGASSHFLVQDTPALHVDAASPPAAAVGTVVTLSGRGFSPVGPSNAVVLAGRIQPVLSASTTGLVVRIVAGATSGDLVVQTSGNVSNALAFTVLAPDTAIGGVVGTLSDRSGVRAIAITPDGSRAYVTNVITNSVTVLDLQHARTLTTITVGREPVAIGLLPDGSRAYVANRRSQSVSILDTDPASPQYHQRLLDLSVGQLPNALAIARDGSSVLVACQGDSTVWSIGARPKTALFDHATKSATVAGGSQTIAISPDGTRAWIGTTEGVSVLDLRSNTVTKSATVASGSQSIAVSPDGAFLYVLTGGGELLVIDVSPGSTNFNKVVKSATVAAGSQTIAVSADGASLFVTDANGRVVVYAITFSDPAAQVTLVPGRGVSLTLQHEYTTGQGASGIAVDPNGRFVLVANSTAGTITAIGDPSALGVVPMGFDFKPHTLNLRSHGRFVEAELFPPAPYHAKDINVASIRIQDLVPVSRAQGSDSKEEEDSDGRQKLKVKFDRLALEALLPAGARVPIKVTGLVQDRPFEGWDTVRVIRGRVRSPHDDELLEPGHTHRLAWEAPEDEQVQFVNVVLTYDEGASWRTIASHITNQGMLDWAVPDTVADSVRVCVLLAEGNEDAEGYAPGMVATSARFRIARVTASGRDVPGRLELARPSPTPARGGTVLLRFGLPEAGDVQLELYDVAGRRLQTLASGPRVPGWHEVRWNGRTAGGLARPGLYWVRLRHHGREQRQPLIWVQ